MGFSDSTKDKVTEKQLVKDLQAGEMGSFEQLANLYHEKIYSLSFNLTRNTMDAQDVTQEVLLILFQKGAYLSREVGFFELGVPNYSQCFVYETSF